MVYRPIGITNHTIRSQAHRIREDAMTATLEATRLNANMAADLGQRTWSHPPETPTDLSLPTS